MASHERPSNNENPQMRNSLSQILAKASANIRRHTGLPLGFVTIAGCGLLTAILGLAVLIVYSQTPGEMGQTPAIWPDASQIIRDRKQPILVVFLHPHCPCSRASVRELEQLLVGRNELRTVIVMLRPEDCAVGWERGSLWDWTQSLNRVEVKVDQGGSEARRFGVATSGHVCLYAEDGQLQFSGGITRARGHEGMNRGFAALERLLDGGQADSKNPVFGCSLFSQCPKSSVEKKQ